MLNKSLLLATKQKPKQEVEYGGLRVDELIIEGYGSYDWRVIYRNLKEANHWNLGGIIGPNYFEDNGHFGGGIEDSYGYQICFSVWVGVEDEEGLDGILDDYDVFSPDPKHQAFARSMLLDGSLDSEDWYAYSGELGGGSNGAGEARLFGYVEFWVGTSATPGESRVFEMGVTVNGKEIYAKATVHFIGGIDDGYQNL